MTTRRLSYSDSRYFHPDHQHILRKQNLITTAIVKLNQKYYNRSGVAPYNNTYSRDPNNKLEVTTKLHINSSLTTISESPNLEDDSEKRDSGGYSYMRGSTLQGKETEKARVTSTASKIKFRSRRVRNN